MNNSSDPDVLEAKKFVLRNEQGKIGATLEMHGKDPRFMLFDSDGKVRVALGLIPSGSVLSLFGPGGK
jgi:hypothetical protein